MDVAGQILIVDDDPNNLLLLATILELEGFEKPITTSDPHEAISLFTDHDPDLVVVDLFMPRLNGFTLIGELRRLMGTCPVPVIAITGDSSAETKQRALRAGAADFLHKPFDDVEIVLRIRNHLEASHLAKEVVRQNELLDHRVAERTAQLEQARAEILERLAIAGEFRDDDTGQHARRVGAYSGAIAEGLGVDVEQAQLIGRAAQLHDLGKMGIPDAILRKPGPLTHDEFEIIKQHTRIGAGMLEGSQTPVLQVAETIARTHHERWDGLGYENLRPEETPLEGRIVAVADAFDAMTSDRPYRKAMPPDAAIDELRSLKGKQFDPEIVDVFLEQVDLTERPSPQERRSLAPRSVCLPGSGS